MKSTANALAAREGICYNGMLVVLVNLKELSPYRKFSTTMIRKD